MEFDVATGSALLARTPGVLRFWLLDLPPGGIARVLAHAFGEAVGPWRAYLRVVRQP